MTFNAVGLRLLAESMGVQIQRHTDGPPGWYDHHRRTISTRRGMSIQQHRSVLAHELGHAHYGDIPPETATTTNVKNVAPTNTPPAYSSTPTTSKPPQRGTKETSPPSQTNSK